MTWHPDMPLEYRNQIVTGDARELAKRIPDESIDLMVTDPPYFLPVNTYVGTREKGWERRTIGDTSVLQAAFDKIMEDLCPKLKGAATAYVFCDGQSYPIMYRAMFRWFKYVRPLIWDKVVSYNGYTWRHQHELIAWGEGYEAERIPTGDGDVLACRGVLQKDRRHPAEKPVDLVMRLIDKHKAARVIFDPYAGSAPVAVAAKRLGRNYVAFEIDPETAEKARERVLNTQPPLFVPEPEQQEMAL
jgi:site-specific DNA-methyltransferase (adenine-specific)